MGGVNGSTLNVCYSSKDNASSWAQASTSVTMWFVRSGHTTAVFDGKLGVLAEMEATEHLTHGTQVMVVPVQKSWLKTMKLQEAEWKVG